MGRTSGTFTAPLPQGRVARANRNQRLAGRSWVYFAQIGEDGPIKIGQSRQVGPRLQALQNAHPQPIRLLGTLPETDMTERECHDRFARHRIRGEWYHPTAELLALAEAGRTLYHDGFHAIIPDDRGDAYLVIIRARPVRSRMTRLNDARYSGGPT